MPVPQKAAPKGGLRPPGLEQAMIGLEQDISSEESELLNREEEQYQQVLNDCMLNELEGHPMPSAEDMDKASAYANTRDKRLKRKTLKKTTQSAQDYQDKALEVLRAFRLPNEGYKQLMHAENDMVALETVLSFDSEEDRHDLCEILDTLNAGCELDSANFDEDQITLFIKHSQNVAHLLKWYYITQVHRVSEGAGMPAVSPTQTLKDELQKDKINFYDKKQPWGNHIMLPERKPQEFEKVLGFKTRREAESVLRVLNIMMYGNSVVGEAQHLEVPTSLSSMDELSEIGSGLCRSILVNSPSFH